jgi:DNA-binding transcriptional regulator LsrR (DeoR family)
VGLLRAKSSEGSSVFGIQLPQPDEVAGGVDYRKNLDESDMMARLREEARACDFVFMGVGTPVCQEGGQPSSFVRLAESIIGKDEYRQAIDDLSIVGEINNQLFDERGVDRNREFPDLDERFVNILSLQDLRAMASKPGSHRVVAIAAGIQKASAIRTALSSGLANVIITSREVAESLLETSGKSLPDRHEDRRQQ